MNSIERHVAGATVSHETPFTRLQVPVSKEMLPSDIRETWIRPLYFGLEKPEAKVFLAKHIHLITDELIAQLLANFDWRSRTVGAYLATLTDRRSLTLQIGNLLLRSDVCYAGSAYCIALAEFNTAASLQFLDDYLTYYLSRKDLWFDQGIAMGALAYLDRLNSTSNIQQHMGAWSKFIENKENWNLDNSITHFELLMKTLHEAKFSFVNLD